MSLQTIRDEIVTIIQGVSGVSNVHDYQRNIWDASAFRKNFVDTDNRVHAWTVTRIKTLEEIETDDHLHTRTFDFMIRGVLSMVDADATEKIFQDLVEDICSAFRGDRTINNAAADSRPPQVLVVDHRWFSKILCHYTEIMLSVDEEIMA